MAKNPAPPPVDGRDAKRRRTDSPEDLPRASWHFLPWLPAEGLLRYIWRSCAPSSFLRRIQGAIPAERTIVTVLGKTFLCLVFERLPIWDVLRCCMTCKAFQDAIQSEEFRSCYRRATVFTAPIVAVITHPYLRIVPVAIPPQSPFQNVQLGLNFGGDYRFISDVRDGYVLLYNSSKVEYQRFLLTNPMTHVRKEIPKPPYNPLHIYIAAGFIPSNHSFEYEIIVLYAHKTENSRKMSTALFDSKTSTWENATHTLYHPAPKSKFDVRLPSVLIGRKWSILIKGSCVLTTDLILKDFGAGERARDAPRVTVQMSEIPLPAPHAGEDRSMVSHNLLGKEAAEEICFIRVDPEAEGLQVWRCDLSSPLPHAFSSPRNYPLGVNGAMLLGFAESNRIAIVQPEFLVPEQTLLIKIYSGDQELMLKEGTDLDLFGYELEWPPIRPRPS